MCVCVCARARARAWVLACVFVCEEKGFRSGQEGYKPNFKWNRGWEQGSKDNIGNTVWNTRKQILYDAGGGGGGGDRWTSKLFQGNMQVIPIPIHEFSSWFRPVQEIWYLDN